MCGCQSRLSHAARLPFVPASRRTTATASAALAVALVGAVVLVLVGAFGGSAAHRSCSSYPTPGTPAPAGAAVPAGLKAKYSVLSDTQQAADKLTPSQITSLSASGVIMSGTRFLGAGALGGRIYLVPAQHLLSSPLAPAPCLSPAQRLVERESLPFLQNEYRQPALCLVALYRNTHTQDCVPTTGTPYALLPVAGTAGFGLVPDGVRTVTVTYQTGPPRTVAVHRNAFVIVATAQSPPACGVQWLDPTGNVKKIAVGCSYLPPERKEIIQYRSYVAGKLATLRSQISALSAAIASGRMAGARSAWLSAHVTWLEIGQDDGAYGAFGTLGGEIDGLAAGHPLGTADPGFTGFHRIEFDLWSTRSLSAARRDVATLERLLAQLVKVPLFRYLPATAAGIGSWLLRPHEVLEDALRDSLTADDDYGSGTDLASVAADVAAVRELLSELGPALDPVSPHLIAGARSELDALMSAIDATRVNGAWVAIAELPVRQRQQVDAAIDAALETLAPVPDLLTSTGSNSPD
jgi:hypothetical protein